MGVDRVPTQGGRPVPTPCAAGPKGPRGSRRMTARALPQPGKLDSGHGDFL
jgi:hypothetical protein